MSRSFICLPLLALCIVGCDSGEPGAVPQAEYEGPLGEAIVRQLIANIPDPAPGIPKGYCLVTGPALAPMSVGFAKRFADLKLRFLSRDVLRITEPNAAVDPETGLAPYYIQIRTIKFTPPATWTADVGWSYKKTFEKHRYEVTRKDDKYQVVKSTRLEGNWMPPG